MEPLATQNQYYPTNYPRQFILIAGGPSVVIFKGLIDQINSHPMTELSEYCIKRNTLYNRKAPSSENDQCGGLFNLLKEEFPQYFRKDPSQVEKTLEKKYLVDLWNNPNFREDYYGMRWKIDPYLVIPKILDYLKSGKLFNVEREFFFYPEERQDYRTFTYSKLTSNYPNASNQLLEFEFFPNCFQADTWANVVAVSFSLSDYDNQNYLDEYFEYCEEIAQFRTYRVIMIFTHPDVFTEKVKSGIIYQGKVDKQIRKELKHLEKDYSLIINSLISKTMKVMKINENHLFPNRTYEYHIVNTSYDSDMKELLNCLAIGTNEKRRNFITCKFDLPPFVIPKKKDFLSNVKLGKLSDISIQCEI